MKEKFDLHDGLGFKLTIAARTNNAGFETDLAGLDITRQAWCVLIAVGEQNISTPSAIAKYIGIIRPAASRTLKQMEKAGLLSRISGTSDKRTTNIALTPKGKDLLERSLPLANDHRTSLSTVLSKDEESQLYALLKKITQSATATASGV